MYISATLPYDIETLVTFLNGYHESVWPLQIVAILAALIIIGIFSRLSKYAITLAGLILSLFWFSIGYCFYISSFSSISFLAPYFGIAFILEALLIFYVCVIQKNSGFSRISFYKNRLGIGLIALSLLFYPALILFFTKSATLLPLVGITPLATSFYTLGALKIMNFSSWKFFVISAIPVIHIIINIVFSAFLLM